MASPIIVFRSASRGASCLRSGLGISYIFVVSTVLIYDLFNAVILHISGKDRQICFNHSKAGNELFLLEYVRALKRLTQDILRCLQKYMTVVHGG